MSIADKLDRVLTRAEEVRHLLSTAEGGQFGALSKELSELEPLVEKVEALRAAERARDEAEAMLADPELRELAEDEYLAQKEAVPRLEREVRLMLLPKDSADERSAILEIRPAAGGDEASLFAAELFRAYQRYAETRRWKFEVMEYDEGELGGVKGAVAEIQGRGVFARLKYESGVHRVQRVPATETQGRIHTSTITVAVLPEAEEVDVQINERTCASTPTAPGRRRPAREQDRQRGPHHPHPHRHRGGMQEERSQHKNRAKAMKILRAADLRGAAGEAGRRPRRRPQEPGRHRRPVRAHPHLQLPPGPRHRPPYRPDPAQDRPRHARRVRRDRRRADRRGRGGAARRGPRSDPPRSQSAGRRGA